MSREFGRSKKCAVRRVKDIIKKKLPIAKIGSLLLSFICDFSKENKSNIRNKINKVAGDLNENEMSFASTLCFICVHKKRQQVMTFVLGDSKVFALYPESICQKNPVNAYKNNETCTVLTDFANEDVGFSIEKKVFLCIYCVERTNSKFRSCEYLRQP